MFDESGTDYQPRSTEKREVREIPVVDSGGSIPSDVYSKPEVVQRPVWVLLTTFFLGFVFFCRIALVTSEQPLVVLVQIGATAVLGVTIVGLLGMRRWGALLFIGYCVWAILSPMITGAYRISIMEDVLTNSANRDWMIFGEVMGWGMALIFYGLLGGWFAANLKQFVPVVNGWELRARVLFIVMAGLLVLHTATQISSARYDLQLQEEIFEDRLQNIFRP